jgi:hypothetical protein
MVIRGKDNFVGLGCLARYINNAQAVTDSIVTPLTRAEFRLLLEQNAKLRLEQANSVEKEFEHRKSQVLGRGPATPVTRLAAFLVTEYRLRAYEGMDSSGASNSFDAGAMCSMLGLDEMACAATVKELKHLVDRRRGQTLFLMSFVPQL